MADIRDADPAALELMLKFMYTCEVASIGGQSDDPQRFLLGTRGCNVCPDASFVVRVTTVSGEGIIVKSPTSVMPVVCKGWFRFAGWERTGALLRGCFTTLCGFVSWRALGSGVGSVGGGSSGGKHLSARKRFRRPYRTDCASVQVNVGSNVGASDPFSDGVHMFYNCILG